MKKAFSLVELAIVLTIISILVAGAVGGTKVLRLSELNGVIKTITKHKSDINTFFSIYTALPGDIDNAQDLWGSAGNLDNGNGDGVIDWSSETFDAHLHMSKAEIIADSGYTGVSGGYAMPIDFNDGEAFLINTKSHFGYYIQNINILQIASEINNALFIPKDAYYIDKKLDDGAPKTGKVTFRNLGAATSNDAACTNSSTGYYISSETVGCNIVFDINM